MQKYFLAASRSSSRVLVAVFKSVCVSVSALFFLNGLAVAESAPSAIDADFDTRPVVYLTFDDGPSADFVTDQLLRVLAKYDATATFFVTGQRVRREPEKIAEIVYAGHAIGNHTVNHAKLTQVSDDRVISELRDASKIILNAGGPPPTCFRPPFGSTDRRVNRLAATLGMVPVGWSIDTRDWEPSISVDAIGSALKSSSDESVVLLHDGPKNRLKMLQAFTRWMARHAHEYQFAALPECSPHSGTILMAGLDDSEDTQSSVIENSDIQNLDLESSVLRSADLRSVSSKNAGAGNQPVANGQAKAAPVTASVAPEVTVSLAVAGGKPEVTSVATQPAASLAESAMDADKPGAQSEAVAKAQTIPELLEKIRAYRIVLHDDGQRVDLTQITATLSSEIHGDHVYFSF